MNDNTFWICFWSIVAIYWSVELITDYKIAEVQAAAKVEISKHTLERDLALDKLLEGSTDER